MRLTGSRRAGNPEQTDHTVSGHLGPLHLEQSRSLRLNRNLDVQCLDLTEKGTLVNAEGLRCFDAVPLLPTQHVRDEDRFEVFHVHGFVARNRLHAGRHAEMLRQVMRFDQPGFAEDKGMLDHVLKFPDIPRIVIGDETCQ